MRLGHGNNGTVAVRLATWVIAAGLGLTAAGPAMGQSATRTDNGGGGATVDGLLGADEYGPGNSYSFTGGGNGFGGTGTLGGGTLYMQSDASKLYIGFQPGGQLNDLVTIHLDTRDGGFTDAQMNDNADGGRRASSNLSRDSNDVFPVLPDYSVIIASFGIVVFELNAGTTDNHLAFKQFDGTFSGNSPTQFREIAIDRSTLGNFTGPVNFFASYVSDSGFLSNESIPADAPYNGAENPGFGTTGGTVTHAAFGQFVAVPEPTSLAFLGLGGLALLRRRRVNA